MSNYLVDGADLTSIANAIRTKGSTSAQLAFPAGFVSAIGDIPTGGTDYLSELLAKTIVSYENSDLTSLSTGRTFQDQPNLVSVSFPNLTNIPIEAGFFCKGCQSLVSINLPKLWRCQAMNVFENCTALEFIVFPSYYCSTQNDIFLSCTSLFAADLGSPSLITHDNIFNQRFFKNCSSLVTLILRSSDRVQGMGNINTFDGTPFASSGAGGTIYIPKALYDHLGDGTALDYKAATNWSTLDGYGTITWAKIEGSQYENYYADGTPVSSS